MTHCLSHRMGPVLNAQLHLGLLYMAADGFFPQFQELSDALRPVTIRSESQHRQFSGRQTQPTSDSSGIGSDDLFQSNGGEICSHEQQSAQLR